MSELRKAVLTAFLTSLATAVAQKLAESAYERWLKPAEAKPAPKEATDAK